MTAMTSRMARLMGAAALGASVGGMQMRTGRADTWTDRALHVHVATVTRAQAELTRIKDLITRKHYDRTRSPAKKARDMRRLYAWSTSLRNAQVAAATNLSVRRRQEDANEALRRAVASKAQLEAAIEMLDKVEHAGEKVIP